MTLRQRVLSCFKELHRTRKTVFAGDDFALKAARIRINEEFDKNRNVSDQAEIEELIKAGRDAAEYVKEFVVQAVYNPEKDVYEMKLRKDHHFEENHPFLGSDPVKKKDDKTVN